MNRFCQDAATLRSLGCQVARSSRAASAVAIFLTLALGTGYCFGQTASIQPSSDAVGLSIAPGGAATQDLLDLYCNPSKTALCFSFSPTGAFTFNGNNATFGTNNQANPSQILLYGGTPSQAFLQESAGALSPAAGAIDWNYERR